VFYKKWMNELQGEQGQPIAINKVNPLQSTTNASFVNFVNGPDQICLPTWGPPTQ
jgi:hypothetical protein